MTLVQDREYLYRECPSITPSVAPLDSSLSLKSGDKLSDQPAGLSKTKTSVTKVLVATINILKYSEDDLQRILKAIFETQASARATGPIRIFFATFFIWDRINFCWQQ